MVTHHNSLTGHGSYAGLKIGVLDGSLPLVLTLRISCGLIPLVVGILFTGFAGQTILAQGRTETILMTGQPAPDGNGIISAVFDGAINDNGQVVVPATLPELVTSAACFSEMAARSHKSLARGRLHPMAMESSIVLDRLPH